MARILVVDDDLSMREFLELMLSRERYDVIAASDGEEALNLAAGDEFDLVISDIRMKNVDGIEVLKGIKTIKPDTVVILISAFATAETAVVAMKEGAYDFIPKPFQLEELKAVIRHALANRTPEAESFKLAEMVKEGCHFGSLVGKSTEMLKIYDLVRRAAQTDTNILITGESGTGKELVARAIHDNSPRASEKFVAINCGGMPEQLIESELFGHKKGAFTGAVTEKLGLFDVAQKGTLFLDELGELSLPMQVKLLRVVQEKIYRAVGGTLEKKLDVRLVTATNKNLETELMEGRFREDLYYRLNVINLHLPPLRERKGDIPLLAQYFLEKYSKAMGKNVRKVSSYALDILSNYTFPGNVRELENIIERSVALEQSNIILPESLTLASFKHQRRLESALKDAVTDVAGAAPAAPQPSNPPATFNAFPSTPKADTPVLPAPTPSLTLPVSGGLDGVLGSLERLLLLQALCQAEGVHRHAAQLLSISSWRLRGRLKTHRLGALDLKKIRILAAEAETDPKAPPELIPAWTPEGVALDETLLAAERILLETALDMALGSKTKASELLGITRRTLHHRLTRTAME